MSHDGEAGPSGQAREGRGMDVDNQEKDVEAAGKAMKVGEVEACEESDAVASEPAPSLPVPRHLPDTGAPHLNTGDEGFGGDGDDGSDEDGESGSSDDDMEGEGDIGTEVSDEEGHEGELEGLFFGQDGSTEDSGLSGGCGFYMWTWVVNTVLYVQD